MSIRILDLDGSVTKQRDLLANWRPACCFAQQWGPRIRLGCGFGRFRRFEQALQDALGSRFDPPGTVTLYGSGDFHHVSLALLRRVDTPVNLLVLDNHPDWMRGVPFLHCGTWLYHAAQLPRIERIFHVGGDVDFDNRYRWLAPWSLLRAGKVVVFPSRRPFHRGRWAHVPNEPLRSQPLRAVTTDRLAQLLHPLQAELARRPLYISVDKDVLVQEEASVNWDSGYLTVAEAGLVLETFLVAARGCLAGMDLVGDWSPVRLEGWPRRLLHWTEHPWLAIDPQEAAQRNGQANSSLLERVHALARAA